MKFLVDKLSKTNVIVIAIITLSLTMSDSSASLTKKQVAPSQVTKTENKIVIAEIEPEELVHRNQSRKAVTLSRGGSVSISIPKPKEQKPVEKKLTEKEQIYEYVREISVKYNIKPELIMSIIEQESNYNPNCKTGSCLGLMQINPRWHSDRAEKLGVKNFYDPYGNILLGVDYISELLKQYKDMSLVLMLYNMDHNTALRMYKSGHISSYARAVISGSEKYK